MSTSSNGFDSTSQNGFMPPVVHNHQYAFQQQTDSNGYHTTASYTNLSPASSTVNTNSTLQQPTVSLDLVNGYNDFNSTTSSSAKSTSQYLTNSAKKIKCKNFISATATTEKN